MKWNALQFYQIQLVFLLDWTEKHQMILSLSKEIKLPLNIFLLSYPFLAGTQWKCCLNIILFPTHLREFLMGDDLTTLFFHFSHLLLMFYLILHVVLHFLKESFWSMQLNKETCIPSIWVAFALYYLQLGSYQVQLYLGNGLSQLQLPKDGTKNL